MKLPYVIAAGLPLISGISGMSSSAIAADLSLKFEQPQLDVLEYHRPYVAVWLERPDQSVALNLALLYDVKKRDNGGTKWVHELRQWWRKSGRDLTLPLDGISGATRPPGEVDLNFASSKSALDKLPPGEYQLVVEAARESGGRETVHVPLQWPPKSAQSLSASGKEELHAVSVQLKP